METQRAWCFTILLACTSAFATCVAADSKSAKRTGDDVLASFQSTFVATVPENRIKGAGTEAITASVVLGPDGVPKVVTGIAKSYRVVWAQFEPSAATTGWARLELHTNGSYSDAVQVQAAGFLEGYLTAQMIWDTYVNVIQDYCTGAGKEEYCGKLNSFISSSLLWASAQKSFQTDLEREYWHQYSLIMEQLTAMLNGFNVLAHDVGGKALSLNDFLIMSFNGDLITLETVLGMPETMRGRKLATSSCSAIVKVVGDNEDVLFSHVTWDSYFRMLRIYKLYDLQVSRDGIAKATVIPGSNVAFSSYAINLQSNDDFYTLGSGLAVMETTNMNFNESLFKTVTFSSLLYYYRVQIANRLATTGEEWSRIFSLHNSGTYNNQWMVFDYNKFTPGSAPRAGALTVLEQLPTYIHVEDLTDTLVAQNYWPSYNTAYFPKVQELSDLAAGEALYGDMVSYKKAPRAKLFTRDHGSVTNIDTLLTLMRSNDFKHDEYGRCNCTPPYTGINAIAARRDLNPKNGKYQYAFDGYKLGGATDCKITNREMMRKLEAYIVAGPTAQKQPVFKWSETGETKPRGHPDAFDFQPLVTKWEQIDATAPV